MRLLSYLLFCITKQSDLSIVGQRCVPDLRDTARLVRFPPNKRSSFRCYGTFQNRRSERLINRFVIHGESRAHNTYQITERQTSIFVSRDFCCLAENDTSALPSRLSANVIWSCHQISVLQKYYSSELRSVCAKGN